MDLFSKINYSDYADQHDFFSLLNVDKNSYGDVRRKHIHSANYSVDSTITEAYPAELDDLVAKIEGGSSTTQKSSNPTPAKKKKKKKKK